MALEKNLKKFLLTWINELGNNGKTTLMQLLKKVFGEYASLVSISILCSETVKTGSPWPEMDQIKDSRVVFASETSINKYINDSILKIFTGNDGVTYRNLFDRLMKEAMISFVFTILTNNCLRLPSYSDKTAVKRIKYIDFPSQFVDNAPETVEQQYEQLLFPRDDDFSDKFPLMIKVTYWILEQYHDKYMKEGLKIPKEMEVKDAEYKERVNVFLQFITDKIIMDSNCDMKLDDVYPEFKAWFMKGNKFGKIPAIDDLEKDFKDRFGKPESGTWKGWKLKKIISEEEKIIGN